MRLLSYEDGNQQRVGWLAGSVVWDLRRAQLWARERGIRAVAAPLPRQMGPLLEGSPGTLAAVRELVMALAGWDPPAAARAEGGPVVMPLARVRLLPPLPVAPRLLPPRPNTSRLLLSSDSQTGQRSLQPGPLPLLGPEEPVPVPAETAGIGFDLQLACVVGRPGWDLPPDQAEDHVAAFTLLLQWLDRQHGPLAVSLGPWLVTPDEWEDRRQRTPEGSQYDLTAAIWVNGQELQRLNLARMLPPVGAVVARHAAGHWLRPGDLIPLAGVPVNGSALLPSRPLRPGDRVEVVVEGLGRLAHTL